MPVSVCVPKFLTYNTIVLSEPFRKDMLELRFMNLNHARANSHTWYD